MSKVIYKQLSYREKLTKVTNLINVYKRIYFMQIILFLFFLMKIISLACADTDSLPTAVNGILDLRNYDFKKKGEIFLKGQWKFYDKQLIEPSLLNKNNNYFLKDINNKLAELNFDGYGTYVLLIKLNENQRDLQLELSSSAFLEHKLWIDNELFDERGIPSAQHWNQINVPYYVGYKKSLTLISKDTLLIVLQVSSTKISTFNGILLETKQNHERKAFWNLFEKLFVTVSLLVMGFYHLILFLFRNKDKSTLYFALFCFQILFFISSKDYLLGSNCLGLPVINSIPLTNFALSLMSLFINTSATCASLFLYDIFKKQSSKKIFITLNIIYYSSFLIRIIALLFFDMMWGSYLYNYIVTLQILSIVIYAIMIIAKAVKHNEDGAKFIAWGMFAFTLSTVIDLSVVMGFINLKFQIVGLGMLCAVLANSIAIANRFSMAFKKIEDLSLRLQSLDKLKDEFLANTSHELRTPINGIIGIGESLIDGIAGKLPQIAIKNLNLIISSGKRLAGLVNDLLDFSKLKNHELHIQRKKVDLYQITEVVLETAKVLLVSENKLELKNNIPKDLANIYGDENRLQQVMFNLIGNAIKFTSEGHVIVSAREVDNSLIEVMVEDTGIGIPEDKFDQIFKSFEQVDTSISREYGGTGLGLSISRQLIELHQGKIWVESEVGHGSRFKFVLPISAHNSNHNSNIIYDNSLDNSLNKSPGNSIILTDNLEQTQQNQQENSTITNQEEDQLKEQSNLDNNFVEEEIKILVVDDEMINVQVLTNQLSIEKYSVTNASNGVEAMKLINAGKDFDLILLDVMMPKMSGYETCRLIRKSYNLFDLPIIMLTAKSQPQDIVTGFKNGANDYVIKPFSKIELLARAQTLLSLKKALKEKERERKEKELMLISKLESLGYLTAGVAHEINNPLVILIGYLLSLKKKWASTNEQKNVIDHALYACNRISSIIKNMTLQYKDQSLPKENFNLNDIITQQVDFIQPIYKEENNIDIHCELAAKDVIVFGTNERFKQVLINLFSNAKDAFTKDGNRIINIKTDNDVDKNIRITISDNGIGIPLETRAKIFDPFFSTKEPGKGSGLGLVICYSAITEMNGKIKIESEVNIGTKVIITLPNVF